jgi:uncharacterized protein involved in type VI secretion and phage assembly
VANKLFFGAQIGIVANSMDPSGKGRVQVRVPAVAGDSGSWAVVCRPFGAVAAGGPQIGASVVVLFEGGDPDYPIVLGRID